MAAEFVLVNPGGRRRRRGATPPRDPRTGLFLSTKRTNGKGGARKKSGGHGGKRRKGGALVTVRTNPGPAAMVPAAMTAADLVVVPAATLAGNPGKRRRKGGGRGRSYFFGMRRNPADGPVDFVQQAVPVGLGVWFGMNMADRIPWIGQWTRSPIGKLVLAYVLNQWGPRLFGPWAEAFSYGVAISAGLQLTQGASLMGDIMEGSEAEAIHAVELDGIEGYFVPEGMEGAFGAAVRHKLPPLRQGGHRGGGERGEVDQVPPGFPSQLWATLDREQRHKIRQALHGPNRDAILQRFVAVARVKGLLGDADGLDGAAADIARELDAA